MRTATTWRARRRIGDAVGRIGAEWADNDLPLAVMGWGYLALASAQRAFHMYGPPLCPFRLLTGHPCPLCGMTHAFGALMAGDIPAAIHFNAFAVPAFAIWLTVTARLTICLVRRALSNSALAVPNRC